ncbi:MAG: phosphotransferase [Deltaproteobacteria bacterium]|jgi:Ser/Thr protein kinase RdoA (MazF antagonist)|nr:phosphotransferase [Deltaproteobacteria bacterium]
MTVGLSTVWEVAERDYGLKPESIVPLRSGRVNDSFRVVAAGSSFCLQRLNDFFAGYPSLGDNWSRAQKAFGSAGLPFPAIIPDLTGEFILRSSDGAYRLTQWLPGRIPSAGQKDEAYLAGQALGLAHQALNVPSPLADLEPLPRGWEFTNQRLPDPEDFDDIFVMYRRHPHLGDLADLLKKASQAAWELPKRPSFSRVFLARDFVIHADPKRENFLINGQNMALVDWDTIGYGDPLVDLGELCRSFAVLKPDPAFQLDLAVAATKGYREKGLDLGDRIPLLLPAVIRALSLALARRYLIDALAEVYFSWDKELFESLFEQNRQRATGLLCLAEELREREMELTRAFE